MLKECAERGKWAGTWGARGFTGPTTLKHWAPERPICSIVCDMSFSIMCMAKLDGAGD